MDRPLVGCSELDSPTFHWSNASGQNEEGLSHVAEISNSSPASTKITARHLKTGCGIRQSTEFTCQQFSFYRRVRREGW
jgi:hypothetical protein